MIIGSRASQLALIQTDMVIEALERVEPGMKIEVVKVSTTGDDVRDRPLKSLGGIGAFTKELDSRITSGEIDVAVNSLKDMPVALTPGTVLAAVLPRGPVEDVLVSELPLDRLLPGSVVGTSSVRRAALVRRARPDLNVKDIRGNVPTRVRKLREGQYDAVVLAKAGIERLGLELRYHTLDPNAFIPSAGQGAIALVCKEGSAFTDVLTRINDQRTMIEVEAERKVLAALGGGCYIPIGVNARLEGDSLRIKANVLDEHSDRFVELEKVLPSKGREGALEEFADRIKKMWSDAKPSPNGKGEVFLVGAGPGDAGLITVKGLEVLRSAQVVIFDSLVGEELLKQTPANAELIDVGKRGSHHKAEQPEINQLLLEKALSGQRVVRLKGGDPFMFGRGGEEAEHLRANGVTVHVVPGVTSAIAVPALAGIPVTHRDAASLVTFVTGHESADRAEEKINWRSLAKLKGTIVILMGMSNLRSNMRRLIDGGLDPKMPVAVVEKGSTGDQRTVVATASSIADACEAQGVGAPAIIVVGDVARLRETLGDLG